MKKIAIIKFSALGDLALIEPFINILSEKYKITMVTSPIGYEYYKDNDNLDFIILKNKKSFLELIKIFFNLFKYELIFDLQGNDRSEILTFLKGNKIYSKYKKNYTLVNLDTNLIKKESASHVAFSIINNFLTEKELELNNNFLRKEKKYIVFNCGSSLRWESKRLPVHVWQDISRILKAKYDLPVYLVGEESEFDYVEEIGKSLNCNYNNLAGKTNLVELKNILKNAYLTISTDSAAMHISAVKKTPTIGIFGATNWIKSAPFAQWSTVVYNKKYFKENIPLKKNSMQVNKEFYEDIDIENALKEIESYL